MRKQGVLFSTALVLCLVSMFLFTPASTYAADGWISDPNDTPANDPDLGFFFGRGNCDSSALQGDQSAKENYFTNCARMMERTYVNDVFRFTEYMSEFQRAKEYKITKSTTAEMAWKTGGEAGLNIKDVINLKFVGEYTEKTTISESIETTLPGKIEKIHNLNMAEYKLAALTNFARFKHYKVKYKLWDGNNHPHQTNRPFKHKIVEMDIFEPTDEHIRGVVEYDSELRKAIDDQKEGRITNISSNLIKQGIK
ncbi:hypothetical protein [Salinithrix halophila]|uniref:Uncharacterized protein n=1 Tax=Salinithrix halophila TaxID=1485204 RepID=A0ABV8JDV2_9BACL